MIHVFHGFLGSPQDFSFLNGPEVTLHDTCSLKVPELCEEDTLIGYSMGGRIALSLASQANFNIKKLILLGANPGLSTVEEKLQRRVFEDELLNKMNAESPEDFLNYWNKLAIFAADFPLVDLSLERYLKFISLFNEYRLSDQEDYLPQIIKNKHKVLWVMGLQDEKYMNLAEDKLLPHDIHVKTISGGHRLFQNPNELMELFHEEGIL